MEAYPRIHSVFVAQHNIDVMTLHCYILIAMDSFARCENRHHSKRAKTAISRSCLFEHRGDGSRFASRFVGKRLNAPLCSHARANTDRKPKKRSGRSC